MVKLLDIIKILLSCAVLTIGLWSTAQAIAPGTGDVQLQCPPGLKVYVDGFLMGTTTESDSGLIIQDIPAKPHDIKLVDANGAVRYARFTIKARQILVLDARYFDSKPELHEECPTQIEPLDIIVGGLCIRSLPVDCLVSIPSLGINQHSKTDKVLMVDNVPVGRHCVVFEGNGQELVAEVEILERKTTYILGNLADKHVYQELETDSGRGRVDCLKRPDDWDEVVVTETNAGIVQIRMRRDWDLDSVDWFLDLVRNGKCDEMAWYPIRSCCSLSSVSHFGSGREGIGWDRYLDGEDKYPAYHGQAGYLARVYSHEKHCYRVVMFEAEQVSEIDEIGVQCFAEVLPMFDPRDGNACRPPSTRENPLPLDAEWHRTEQPIGEICIEQSFIRSESRPAEWLRNEVAGFYSYADPQGDQGRVCVADCDDCTPIYPVARPPIKYEYTSNISVADKTIPSVTPPAGTKPAGQAPIPAAISEAIESAPTVQGSFMQPIPLDECLWRVKEEHEGLEYVFAGAGNGEGYKLELTITNRKDEPVNLEYPNGGKFNFLVEAADAVNDPDGFEWEFNFDKFYQNEGPYYECLGTQELNNSRCFQVEWDGKSNNGQEMIPGKDYIISAISLAANRPDPLTLLGTKAVGDVRLLQITE